MRPVPVLAAVAVAALIAAPAHADTTVAMPPADQQGGAIPPQFVGLSIEWSLAERYMNGAAQPAFANLLGNLGGGLLRMGGSSQDVMPFAGSGANTIENITPSDLALVRQTMDRVDGDRAGRGGRPADWGVILGTSLAPASTTYPWRGPDNAKAFTGAVAQTFTGHSQREVTSIGLGNEPDISYDGDVNAYLADFARYQQAGATRPFALDVPSTSEVIAPWSSIAAQTVETRWFYDWPQILAAQSASTQDVRSSQGPTATDHFYPLARGCTTDDYRCASIDRLLSKERLDNLDYVVDHHATVAAQDGLRYRLGELNTAAGRGVDGVSNRAASATWALDAMFHAACPQPPDQPGANASCSTGAIGVNFHNAEVNDFFKPEEGNGFYNAIDYDPTPAAGAPTAAPEYYALLFFGRLAQGTSGLRPLPGTDTLSGWRVDDGRHGSRLFFINRGSAPTTVNVTGAKAGATFAVNRMTPVGGLDAAQVQVDGRSVAADGTFAGLVPQQVKAGAKGLTLTLAPGEAVSAEPAS